MAAQSSVFISYSRKDYYFAESLAFHLLRAGVPAWMDVKDLEPGKEWERGLSGALAEASTLLLVVSAASIASERVKDEWRQALERGCRIVAVRFRNAALPPELASCEVVDFRGSFRRAFRRLMARLAADPARSEALSDNRRLRWFAIPPWVALMTLALALPLIGYFAAANWALDPNDEFRQIVLVAAPLAALGLAWFFCFAFLRRRMGMTRLALCLFCLALVFALPLLAFLFTSLSFLATEQVAAMFSRHWVLGALLLAIPLAGLLVLVLVRPEDLLRWTPTGKVWPAYRIGHVANAVFGRAELAFQLEQMSAFSLSHDPVDAPMAQRLREELGALGRGEELLSGEQVTPVLLLTNRTQRAWIDAQPERVRGAGLTVVGTRIDLPPSLDWLWSRQWIDFRGWNVGKKDPGRALPQVPDAVTQARLPGIVARVRHVLCAIAALLFTLAGAVSPEDGSGQSEVSSDEVLLMASFAVSLWWGVLAHRIVKRSRPAALVLRDGLIGCAVTVIVVALDLYELGDRLNALRMAVVATFLAAAWAWLATQYRGLSYWLPVEKLTRAAREGSLGSYRDWSTLIWVVAYMVLWMWVLGFSD